MFLDRPGRFLYKHHVNLYPAMRAFCSDYRYIVCGGVLAVAVLLAWLVTRTSALTYFGVLR